ncbi:MAG: geranylgeranyl pyrophosphate synthase, partial [Burkholderia sp.]|nr:geranylgeranyl pyrophosphate synthase [Burkholderia sp.]
MDPLARIELALERALRAACGPHAPPRLGSALRHAVFPGGARVRPRLASAAALASRGRTR